MFKKEINAFMSDLEDDVYGFVADVGEHILESLISSPPTGTPRDTWTARNSWRFSNKNTVDVDLERASKEKATAALAKQESSKRLLSKNNLKSLSEIYINNPMPYIARLNYTEYSTQSKFFVETALQSAKYTFK